jgi:Flp pilus assembly protein TadG
MLRPLLRRLWRDRRGVSLVEFALVVPIFSLMILGGTEIARYILLNQKLDRLATQVSDLTSQEVSVTASDLSNIFDASLNVAWPFNIQSNGVVIVSSVGWTNNRAQVLWQRSCPGSGCSWTTTQTAASRIGTQGNVATMPTGFTVSATNTNVIVTEVYYTFTPFLWRFMPAGTLYHIAITRPRLNDLTTIN